MDRDRIDSIDRGVQRHTNTYIHAVISLLKQHDRPLSFEEIKDKTRIDLHNNYVLLQSIKRNPRIVATHSTLMFKPLYSIRSVEDMRKVVRGLGGEEGLEMSKLMDSPVNVVPFVEELKKSNEIIILNDIDGSEVVFWNDTQESPVDPQIKSLWNQVRITTYHDLIRELNTAGLKTEKVENVKKRPTIKIKKDRRSRRKIRITNTHVKGLDLSGVQDER
ncbi:TRANSCRIPTION INITIATION FACTOR TFIIE BETA SUBUNIT [Encephalitozoon cuniculi GB-M1]|uniref:TRANSCRIPTION INITIATION FACTOR TFIIE BETA SUBUNIT n=2 Tax=Encephalitozoon cuniculi TaxID=6035 RepID=Q8SRS3_ENCCU|nr:transcription initiation factor IIE subunit beta [Encephalitozoon cuniculi GB-M1]KMV65931.1 transcription initiation factor IIE subunitbeta [Encephalitozoon cuniculi EcunIII-L]UYI27622.1 putative transcription initiation factor IIE subunit [Encephalitozoon cuniculi]CAD25395.2 TRANSCRIPTION INITIATION FACTOR TFIIE BETA SUBUNIT [Encephalitozoon cuniculi GB-M1]